MDDASQAAACFDRALEAQRQGRLAEAAGLAQQAFTLDPESLDASLLAATALHDQDLVADAIPFAERALNLLPRSEFRERTQPVLRLLPLAARDAGLKRLLLDTVDGVSTSWTASPDLLPVLAFLATERPSSAIHVVERLLAEEPSLLLYGYLEWALSRAGKTSEGRTKAYLDALMATGFEDADVQVARLDGPGGGQLPAEVRARVRGWVRERFEARVSEIRRAPSAAAVEEVDEPRDEIETSDSDGAWGGWLLLALLIAGTGLYLVFFADPKMRQALAAVVILVMLFNGGELPSAVDVLNLLALTVLTIAVGWAEKADGPSGLKALGAFVGLLIGSAVGRQLGVGPRGELALQIAGAFLGLIVSLYPFGRRKRRAPERVGRRLRGQLRLEARLKGEHDGT